ncbi:hypothetical protein GCM10010350_44140 [Streptomyces galilaeus]|nr:hypothetical protein GCM10010350_44140 [Streptomyces galilaeus]
MNPEDQASSPAPHSPPPIEAALVAEARRIASSWDGIPPEVFRAALASTKAERALRSQEIALRLNIEHDLAVKRIEAEKAEGERQARAEREIAEREVAAAAERLQHRRHIVDVSAGAGISISLLGVGAWFADSAPWLSAVCVGPSLLALAKVFVLRRSDPHDMKVLGRAARDPNAGIPGGPPSPPL